jgi:hypothetical protein
MFAISWRCPPAADKESLCLVHVSRTFVGIQKLEVTSGELPLFGHALGHAGLHERSGRDPLKHVVVPHEQLA